MARKNNLKRGDHNGARYGYKVRADASLVPGCLVGLTADLQAIPGGVAATVAIVGIAENHAKGGETVIAERGCFRMHIEPEPAVSMIGQPVFARDNFFGTMDGSGNKRRLGVLEAIDAEGTWVRV